MFSNRFSFKSGCTNLRFCPAIHIIYTEVKGKNAINGRQGTIPIEILPVLVPFFIVVHTATFQLFRLNIFC